MNSKNKKPILDPLRLGIVKAGCEVYHARFEIREPLLSDFNLTAGDSISVTFSPESKQFIIEKDRLARSTVNKKFRADNVWGFSSVVRTLDLRRRTITKADYVIKDNKLLVSY